MANNNKEVKEIKLKVAEAYQRDVFRGIVRMDEEAAKKIEIRYGDVVEIEGKKKTVAIVQPALPEDYGLGIIRMDGIIRKNAGATLGGYVTVRKAAVKEAQKVILAPAQRGVSYSILPSYLLKLLIDRPVVKGDLIVLTPSGYRNRMSPFSELSIFEEFFSIGFGPEIKLTVVNTVPKGPVIITDATEIELLPQAVETKEEIPDVTYEDIGDMKEVVSKVRELVELPLKYPEIFEKLGIEPPKGVLLYGPPGTGKTLLAKAVANESGANFIAIKGPEIFSKWFGESEKIIREIFRKARQVAPTIIFFDEIDAIAPRRGTHLGTSAIDSIVNQLLAEMDGITERGDVVIIAATNRPDILDPAMLRPGRIDRIIYVPPPDYNARLEILKIHTKNIRLDKNVNLEEIAKLTEGYVGADLELLVKEAAIFALREAIDKIKKEKKLTKDEDILKELENMDIKVNMEHFRKALEKVRPSVTKEMEDYYKQFSETFRKRLFNETTKYYG